MSLQTAWYKKSGWLLLLWPVSLLFRLLAGIRRKHLSAKIASSDAGVPVIVVGNITVGGTGKTPLLQTLVSLLQEKGFRPGIISRGHGSKAPGYPFKVTPGSTSAEAGDEPLLLARTLRTSVVIDPLRKQARDLLLQEGECNVILSDDGLQHYALARQMELVVIDGQRMLGNALCLPAGPLRETPARLREVDFILINSADDFAAATQLLHTKYDVNTGKCHPVRLQADILVNLASGEQVSVASLAAHPELQNLLQTDRDNQHAVAGIGNPERFFRLLESLGISVSTRAFPDHHPFQAADLDYATDGLLLMTAKDAVKCEHFAQPGWWYLSVSMQTTDTFNKAFLDRVLALTT